MRSGRSQRRWTCGVTAAADDQKMGDAKDLYGTLRTPRRGASESLLESSRISNRMPDQADVARGDPAPMNEKVRILIADGSSFTRKLLRAEFSDDRYDVHETDNGLDAIRLTEDLHPHITTLGLILKGCNGIETCRAISSNPGLMKTTVVMITSNDSPEERHQAFEAGAVRFLQKGMPHGELRRYVEEITRTRNGLEGSSILVVDDNPFVRQSVARLLESEGAIVYHADNGRTGLKIIDEHEIDVVLTDYHMPEMDGIELVEALRDQRDHEAMPVLFVSGSGDRASRVRALDVGANDFIRKPFEAMELVARTRSFVRLAHLTRKLTLEARTDALTGLMNRRETLDKIEDHCGQTRRYNTPFSAIMIDIDHFKHFNDTYGHAVGDVVLKTVSKAMKDCIRRTDAAGRLGGEEFVVLCTNTPAEAATVCAEKIRQAVERHVTRHESLELAVTISLGVAEFSGGLTSVDSLLNAADVALYEAKNSGRNQVRVHGQPAGTTLLNA